MEAVYILIATAVGFLLASLGACALAIRWSTRPAAQRPGAALALSVLGLVIGYLGMTRFRFTYSKTVNGSGWTVDSKWFFVVPLALGVSSLALAVRSYLRSRRQGQGLESRL